MHVGITQPRPTSNLLAAPGIRLLTLAALARFGTAHCIRHRGGASVLALAAVALMLLPGAGHAEEEVPARLQAAVFKRAFAYDRSLRAKASLMVLVVDDGPGADVATALNALGVSATLVKPAEASKQLPEAAVLYLTRASSELKALCAKHGVLSISGNPALTQSGDVSIALKAVEGKPRILVNRSRVKAEGQDLAAELLALSTLVD